MVAVDTSFFFSLYLQDTHSRRASAWVQAAVQPLPMTAFLRHELRNAIRLAVYRDQITTDQRDQALLDIENDLRSGIVMPAVLPDDRLWLTADQLSALHTETLGNRGMDILHVAAAVTLGATDFLTFDQRQRTLAQAAGSTSGPDPRP